jgi:methylated-DNA-protein-cysteine methyltransferase related protein
MSSIKKAQNSNSFFNDVYEVARLVPKGRVTTYGAIARYLGTAGSSRMVGWAMNGAQRQIPPVPAQRVVNRIGLLTGKHHFGSPDLMQQLLENEGVAVENDLVVDFKKLFWDPSEEL